MCIWYSAIQRSSDPAIAIERSALHTSISVIVSSCGFAAFRAVSLRLTEDGVI
jgi:hypothetical protein